MNAIIGYADLLATSPHLTETGERQISSINNAGEHLLNLINDVLEVSKIEAGRMIENRQRIDLPSVLTELTEMFQFRVDRNKLALSLELADDLPDQIEIDDGKLSQIIINLLGNAVKFTTEGHIVMRAFLVAGGETSRLCIEVEDTGPGIAKEELSSVFASFEQTATGRASGGGTGLGLALSRDYARFLGGDLRVESEVGVGTKFRLDLIAKLDATAPQ